MLMLAGFVTYYRCFNYSFASCLVLFRKNHILRAKAEYRSNRVVVGATGVSDDVYFNRTRRGLRSVFTAWPSVRMLKRVSTDADHEVAYDETVPSFFVASRATLRIKYCHADSLPPPPPPPHSLSSLPVWTLCKLMRLPGNISRCPGETVILFRFEKKIVWWRSGGENWWYNNILNFPCIFSCKITTSGAIPNRFRTPCIFVGFFFCFW